MKNFIRGLLIMIATAIAPTVASAENIDELAIKTAVESVAVLADSGNYESLEKLYADEIRVDYTSLAGGEVEVKSPQALMTDWASVLPGFDRTRHNLSNIQVDIDGKTAIAKADVEAEHYVGGLYWLAVGDYRYEFVETGEQWLIAGATFNLRREEGTRDVFGPAAENAAAEPPAYMVRQQTKQIVRTFLESLETKDMDAFASVWAEDAVQDMPYSPDGHPKRVVGKDALLALYSGWPENSGEADFTSELVFYTMQDPRTVFVEYKGTVEVLPTDRIYKQVYGGLFHVVDNKIQLFREYYDPAPFAWAFGLNE